MSKGGIKKDIGLLTVLMPFSMWRHQIQNPSRQSLQSDHGPHYTVWVQAQNHHIFHATNVGQGKGQKNTQCFFQGSLWGFPRHLLCTLTTGLWTCLLSEEGNKYIHFIMYLARKRVLCKERMHTGCHPATFSLSTHLFSFHLPIFFCLSVLIDSFI